MIDIPNAELNISRSVLPQIKGDSLQNFLNHLDSLGVKYTHKTMKSCDLKPTQGEFNIDKVKALIRTNNDTKPIIVSKDNYVLDGHHRWLADYNSNDKSSVIMVDQTILDLITTAKTFDGVLYKNVTENVSIIKGVIKENLRKRKIL
jgi:predicted glutamine amidotransferase